MSRAPEDLARLPISKKPKISNTVVQFSPDNSGEARKPNGIERIFAIYERLYNDKCSCLGLCAGAMSLYASNLVFMRVSLQESFFKNLYSDIS